LIDVVAITRACDLLQSAAPDAKVFLYGSYARGDAREDSDLDFLIVEPDWIASRSEKVRLRSALGTFDVPIDLLVVSEAVFQEWLRTPGMLEERPSPAGTQLKAVNFSKRILDFLTEYPNSTPNSNAQPSTPR
jgi:predicted nucleotidyltransferase